MGLVKLYNIICTQCVNLFLRLATDLIYRDKPRSTDV